MASRLLLLSVVLPLVLLLCPSFAVAHSMYLFAQVDGATIQGKAYFRGNIPAQDMTVTAFDPAGEILAQTKTDQQGLFKLEAKFHCDYRLLVDTGDGHGAEFKVVVAQLPEDLPPRGATSDSPEKKDDGPDSRKEQSPDADTADASHVPAPPMPQDARLKAILAEVKQLRKELGQFKAIRADIGQLREGLADERQRMRIDGIVGGIGCILGIAGVVFYFLGVRRRELSTRQ